jgi:4-amino-4-deoxy-L-arabinose transferase-like glycosyltransferase
VKFRPSERQVALLVILGGLLLYLPFAGSYGLWDPWETHYSEVARQMTHRGDYISLWWPGSPRDPEPFWSKPVLSFWIMSLAMRIAGVGLPGGPAGEMALGHRAEWAARVPFCLMGVLGIYAVYLVTSRFVSRRAGLIAAVVVATAPMYSLVARQAMTDMACVGPMAMAIALGALALFPRRRDPTDGDASADGEPEDVPLPRKGRGLWSHPAHPLFYGTIALFAITVLPQLVVDSIQLKVVIPWGERELKMYGAVAMIPYYIGFLLFVFLAARTRYAAPFYLYLAAILCGLSVLAKGFAGLGLPVMVLLGYLTFTWSWRRLGRAQLLGGLVVATIALAVVAVPWHHAMFIRHGPAWWSELYGDNHWRRMVIGRHGDRGTFDYFVRELGYGLWPWVAFAPAALGWAVLRREPGAGGRASPKQAVILLGAIWAVSGYALVSLSMTKFHHYVLPAIPGFAIVIGAFIDDLWTRRASRTAVLASLVGIPLVALVAFDFVDAKNSAQKFLWLFSYDYVHNRAGRAWPAALDFSGTVIAFAVAFAIALVAFAVPRVRRYAVVALGGIAIAFTFFLLDGFMPAVAPFWSQKGPIAAYYENRRSPEERLVAFQLYWRGETFYTSNEIYEGPPEERTVFDAEGADDKLKAWIGRHRGRRTFFLFERFQQGRLIALLPPESRSSFHVVDEKNNKFTLAEADL